MNPMHAELPPRRLAIINMGYRLRRIKQQIFFLVIAISIASAYEVAMLFAHAWFASAIGASIIIGSLLYVSERVCDLSDIEQQAQDLLDDGLSADTESDKSSVTSFDRYLRRR